MRMALEEKSMMTMGGTALQATGAIPGEGLSSKSSADNTPDVGGTGGWVLKGQLSGATASTQAAFSAAWVHLLPIIIPPYLGTMLQRFCLVSCPGKTYKGKVGG